MFPPMNSHLPKDPPYQLDTRSQVLKVGLIVTVTHVLFLLALLGKNL